jgi:putative transposase
VLEICAVLEELGVKIAPSTYYEHRDRIPTEREQRDEELKVAILRVHSENYGVYGARCGCNSTAKRCVWPAARWNG